MGRIVGVCVALLLVSPLTSCMQTAERELRQKANEGDLAPSLKKDMQAHAKKSHPRCSPGRARLRHILIRHQGAAGIGASRTIEQARRLAKKISKMAKAGQESFDVLARRFSDCGSKTEGGKLGTGCIRLSVMVQPFERAALKLKKGGISDAVKTRYGYHVIQRQD
jgi:parvulin-like peptidyl-prolyl isomerase